MRRALIILFAALALSVAQAQIPTPGPGLFGDIHFKGPVGSAGALAAVPYPRDGDVRARTDVHQLWMFNASLSPPAWQVVGGGGGITGLSGPPGVNWSASGSTLTGIWSTNYAGSASQGGPAATVAAGVIGVSQLGGACAPVSGTDVIVWNSSGTATCVATPSGGGGGGLTNPIAAGSLSSPGLQVGEATTGLVGQLGTHTLSAITFGIEAARFEYLTGAVNYVDLLPSATGNMVQIRVQGADTNIGLSLVPKGNGIISFFGSGSGYAGLAPRPGFPFQTQLTDGAGSSRQTLWLGSLGLGGTMNNFSANDFYATQTGNAATGVVAISANGSYGIAPGGDASQQADTKLSRLPGGGGWSADTTTERNSAGYMRMSYLVLVASPTPPYVCASGPPAGGPSTGLYINTTSMLLCVCNGTAWVQAPGGSPGVSTGC